MSSPTDNDRKQTMITEESPVLQSVAIMQRTSPSSVSPSLQFSPEQQQPFSSLSPLARNTSLGLKKGNTQTQNTLPAVVTTTETAKDLFEWKVHESQIQQLPEDYVLERTHVQVNAHEVSDIAQRISNCLQNHSIETKYKETTVKAQTSDRVKFYIRFYKSSNNKVIVEVQRRCGCSFLFHNTCRSVFRAIRGNGTNNTSLSRSFTVPDSVKQQMAVDNATSTNGSSNNHKMEEISCAQKDIKIATRLLQDDRLDSNLMGLESLVSLTQPTFVQRVKAAQTILSSQDLLQTILNLVHKWKITCHSTEPFDVSGHSSNHHDDSDEDDGDDDSVASIEQDYLVCMHRQALTLMSNCFDVISLENTTNNSDINISDKLLQGCCRHSHNNNQEKEEDRDAQEVELLSNLIQDFANAANQPSCDAYEAATCIKGLLEATSYCSCHFKDNSSI